MQDLLASAEQRTKRERAPSRGKVQAGLWEEEEEEGVCPSHAHSVEQGPAGAESSPDAHIGAARVACSL